MENKTILSFTFNREDYFKIYLRRIVSFILELLLTILTIKSVNS